MHRMQEADFDPLDTLQGDEPAAPLPSRPEGRPPLGPGGVRVHSFTYDICEFILNDILK